VASALPALADAAAPAPAPAVDGVLGAVDGGLLGGLVGGLLHGQGGVFGPDGGVLAGSNTLGDVLGGLGALSAVGDVAANPQIGGEGSFANPSGALGGLVTGAAGGVLGGLLSGGGLLGGIL
jgi:hypothetical protein